MGEWTNSRSGDRGIRVSKHRAAVLKLQWHSAIDPDFEQSATALRLRSGFPMRDWRDALEDRTQAFAHSAIDVSVALSTVPGLHKAADQLNQAATSVAANHRAMRRARSDREFAAKLQIVVEESDEAVFWLELAAQRSRPAVDVTPLLKEARELRAIFVKSRATTRNRQRGRGASDQK